jgi:hypothetical protein
MQKAYCNNVYDNQCSKLLLKINLSKIIFKARGKSTVGPKQIRIVFFKA